MQWNIPAKTFLLGEYIALQHGPALLIGTQPCFRLKAIAEKELRGIHPESPAGKLFRQQNFSSGFEWFDPYQGKGGLGASSAQFVGLYQALCQEKKRPFQTEEMLELYYQHAWDGQGARPSGYDIISQSAQQMSFIHQQNNIIKTLSWPFDDLDFILVHTGKKLATHQHLQSFSSSVPLEKLSKIVYQAKAALEQKNADAFINCINNYQQALFESGFTAEHSLQLINELKQNKNILAIKGCGAMGADILLILCKKAQYQTTTSQLLQKNIQIIAKTDNLFKKI